LKRENAVNHGLESKKGYENEFSRRRDQRRPKTTLVSNTEGN